MSENSNQLAAVVGDILERFSATASGNDYTLKTVCGPRTKPSRDNRRTRPDLLENRSGQTTPGNIEMINDRPTA